MGKYGVYGSQARALSRIVKTILTGNDSAKRDVALRNISGAGSRSTQWRYKKSLEELISSGFLEISGERIAITQRGVRILRMNGIYETVISKKQKWDGVWHVVAYDIPEKCKRERDYFQRKIKDWGFYQIQDSLWVFPYNYDEEIALLANELGLANYVAFLRTSRVPFDSKARKFFELSS